MSTKTPATIGSYFVEDGPSMAHLNEMEGQGRNKKLSLRDRTVVFDLTNKSDDTPAFVRMVVTEVDSDSIVMAHVTGFDVGSSHGKVTIQYDPYIRKGELEIVGHGPLVAAIGRRRVKQDERDS